MTVSSFIKENRVLVAGLVLPLLLIGILAVAKGIPASRIPLPAHKVMYYSAGWSSKGEIVAKVNSDGKLTAVFNAAPHYTPAANDRNPTTIIFLYDPQTNSVDDTTVTLDEKGNVTALEKFKDLQLSDQSTAPDGYIFEPYRYRGYSLITDIFSYRYYQSGPTLTYNGRIITLPQPPLPYGTLKFIGWEE